MIKQTTYKMEINLLAFGQIADITGKLQWKMPDVNNTDDLKQKLAARFPALRAMKYSLAVNKKVISGNVALDHDDTVALLPPFSGG